MNCKIVVLEYIKCLKIPVLLFRQEKAVSEATSEWISSLDADDYYEPYFLEKLYNRILETKADIVVQRMICITDGGEVIDTIPKTNFDISQIYGRRGVYAYNQWLGYWL